MGRRLVMQQRHCWGGMVLQNVRDFLAIGVAQSQVELGDKCGALFIELRLHLHAALNQLQRAYFESKHCRRGER
jgi:hypothetical protein